MNKFKEWRRRGKWLYRAIHIHKMMKNSMYNPENSELEELATHPVTSCGPNTDSSQLTDPARKSKDNDLCGSPQTV